MVPRILSPELFFGFVAPIGTDLRPPMVALSNHLALHGYRTVELKVTDLFSILEAYIKPTKKLTYENMHDRYETFIAYGNQVRTHLDDNAVLAELTSIWIAEKRKQLQKHDEEKFQKTAYLIYQFKRREEIDVMRTIYGRLFFQISVYSRRGARVDYLSRKFASSDDSSDHNKYRAKSEEIVEVDEFERNEKSGQRVSEIFHDGDLIINIDIRNPSPQQQIDRFCEILFGSNKFSPSKMEYGMFSAKAAALRTLDLSRQVGAAIFTENGEIVSVGSNEVPKAGGGTYWCDDNLDARDYTRFTHSNLKRKKELLRDLFRAMKLSPDEIEEFVTSSRVLDSQFMDALEYARMVHAEMSAICDAARLGRSVRGAVLYSTTFPCHMCAKHIVAAGLRKVVFLEPYPKSLATDLHSDSIDVENSDRGIYGDYPSVEFVHFYGITPRRYRGLFERGRRKDKDGCFVEYKESVPRPLMRIRIPLYAEFELATMQTVDNKLGSIAQKISEWTRG